MKTLANLLVVLVAALHIGFMVMEVFFWTAPFVLRAFAMTEAQARETTVLAANQGVYNGFLAAGLLWGLMAKREAEAIKVFFLGCVIVAGIFGAVTAKSTILYVQALPAMLALFAVKMSPR